MISVLLQLRSISFCRLLAFGQVAFLRRLEDPAAAAAVPAPHGAASPHDPRRRPSNRAGPPVRSPRCPTCPSVPAFALASLQRLTCPRQRSFEPGSTARYPASYHETTREEPGPAAPLSCCLSAARHSLLGHPVPPGNSAPLTVGLPHRRVPAPAMRTLAGFPRSARMRPGPGRAPSLPRGQRCPPAGQLLSSGSQVRILLGAPRGYRQNCRCCNDRTVSVTLLSMVPGSVSGC